MSLIYNLTRQVDGCLTPINGDKNDQVNSNNVHNDNQNGISASYYPSGPSSLIKTSNILTPSSISNPSPLKNGVSYSEIKMGSSTENISEASNDHAYDAEELFSKRSTNTNSPIEAVTTIPSPPLSPYNNRPDVELSETRFSNLFIPTATRDVTSSITVMEDSIKSSASQEIASRKRKLEKDDESEQGIQELKGPVKLVEPKALRKIEILEDTESIFGDKVTEEENDGEIIAVKNEKSQFPLKNLKYSTLYIDPFSDLKKPGYKRRQLSFLNQYSLVSIKPTLSSKKSYNSSTSQRHNTVPRTIKDYSSDTDGGSGTDRVRTRRVAKESSVSVDPDAVFVSRPSTPRKRKPTVKRVDSPSVGSPAPTYNFNYENIPDFSPSLDTLPNNSKCLKTEWKGQPMNLSSDPLCDKLHPAEITLASILRLPCNVYLDSKRRLFQEKVNRLKRGLPFRRTDAQKACKIDVNKASRLYASFEKVGWLKDHHFTSYMK
ncbi:unnamed protein product [[Candida] boidinii]|uniref:Unnamed protein product n=1 Tax=Candida boidinii TaxID=5477 RepID=A0A9W6SYC7_CANBO|nr:hypothetical protein B5S30_g5096 [[Candida] boidinii]OWB85361.1 hypothetical protein B5S33_g4026 [[Candida] boidinii]GME68622.1 unnamed protein product [[Candida] boidinii]GMF98545.1 unnamed protein product [[Candida] boidinii]